MEPSPGLGAGEKEQSEVLRSGVPAEGHPPGLCRAPMGAQHPHIELGDPACPQARVCPQLESSWWSPVVPSWPQGCFGAGCSLGLDFGEGSPITPSPHSCRRAAVPGGVGAGGAVPTPPVSRPHAWPAPRCHGAGRGVAETGPQGPPGHPGPPVPLAAKCCVSSVGVDLRYHLAAALPSRGHRCPRVPAPCRRATGVAAPD